MGKMIRYETTGLIRKNDAFDPELAVVKLSDGRTGIIKDFQKCTFIMRSFIGEWLLNREEFILNKLTGIEGVPNVLLRADKNAMIYEYIPDTRPIHKFHEGELPVTAYEKLSGIVKAIHERGVIHFDLRQKRNILISRGMQVYIVDFATSFYFRLNSVLQRRLFGVFRNVDKSALLKIKNRLFRANMTETEKAFLKEFLVWRSMWLIRPKKFRAKDKVQ
ncbi:MAG: hypothetical protein HZA48_02795 [Planctomycetes bacterium]|nr:hypothetical protein [Planctomycetota bacterium]